MVRLIALALAAWSLGSAAHAAPSIVLRPSRTSGVAPLAVHFDAADTTAPGMDAFSQLGFQWDFGDAGAGTWPTSGLPKNSALGPVAAHVYETPGTYTVSLSVTEPSGAVTPRTATITVEDPNTAFAGTDTVCVSVRGDFSGCPAGARTIVSSSFNTAVSAAVAGSRVLLRRGEAYAASQLGVNHAGPTTIGAFGSGAKPLIKSAVGTLIKLGAPSSSLQDIRFVDLAFDGSAIDGSRAFDAGGAITDVLFLRISLANFDNMIYAGPGAAKQSGRMHKGMFVVESQFDQFSGAGAAVSATATGFYLSGHQLVWLGNRVDYLNAPDHLLRLPYIERSVISSNRLQGAGAARHVVKLCALEETEVMPFPERRSREFVFSDNEIVGTSGGWDVAVGPQNTISDERVERAIFERNLFRLGPTGGVSLMVFGSSVTARNNVFDSTKAGGGDGVVFGRRGIEPIPVGNAAVNNTCFSGSGAVACAKFQAGTGHYSANNLAVGPSGSIASGLSGPSNLVVATPTWAIASPVKLSDFRTDPARGGPVVDRGAQLAEVTVDPLGVSAPYDGNGDGVKTWDIGAFEVGTATSGGGGTTTPPPPLASAPAAPVLLP